MLKWAKPNQRRVSECSDSHLETCSNLSSDSSESGITLPIRYHERRASRPKSLALSSTDVLDFDHEQSTFITRRPQRTGSSPLYSSCSRANRHSMIVIPRETTDHPKLRHYTSDSLPNHNNNMLKISTDPSDSSTTGTSTGVLKISTADCDKPKSRNSFWRNLRAKAQGKKSEKKLAKAHSMSNIPDLTQQSTSPETAVDSKQHSTSPETAVDSKQQSGSTPTPTDSITTNDTLSTTCPSPIVVRRQQRPLAEASSPTRSRTNVMRRRSFKLIKKQNENKKPKAFSKNCELSSSMTVPTLDNEYPQTESPDSGISSVRHPSSSNTDSDYEGRNSPVSPITPIDIGSNKTDLVCLRQQFTDAVLQYLNERLEKKGYASVIDRTSSASSTMSDDGAADIFCYDTDTVARRPSHRSKRTVEPTH